MKLFLCSHFSSEMCIRDSTAIVGAVCQVAVHGAAAGRQDDELEDWQIEELRKKSETRRALDKAMDYLSPVSYTHLDVYKRQLCGRGHAHGVAGRPDAGGAGVLRGLPAAAGLRRSG